jgi:uncharacterized Fe-S radical SAM superfamily protein PflX
MAIKILVIVIRILIMAALTSCLRNHVEWYGEKNKKEWYLTIMKYGKYRPHDK